MASRQPERRATAARKPTTSEQRQEPRSQPISQPNPRDSNQGWKKTGR